MENEKCKCKYNDAESEHTCPYDVEMRYNDDEDSFSLCTCCSDCESNCAGDI